MIAAPAGEPPKTLQKHDLVTGSVRKARNGDTVSVQYSLVTWSDGKARDSSWDRGAPFSFPLGAGQVIPGFDQGIKGMKIGGRREIVIPPDLGYGDQGAGDVIKPGETLLYVVDLVSIDPNELRPRDRRRRVTELEHTPWTLLSIPRAGLRSRHRPRLGRLGKQGRVTVQHPRLRVRRGARGRALRGAVRRRGAVERR